jgi:N-acetylglucosamine-6-phosphate deacetylase
MPAEPTDVTDPGPTNHPFVTNGRPTGDDRPSLVVTGGRVPRPDGTGAEILSPADLVIEGHRVGAVVRPGAAPEGGARLDATGLIVAPGFVDLQINGGHGIDLWSEPSELWTLGRLLPRHGVTAFCPTIVSGPPDRAEAALAALADGPADHVGAEPIGLHLEGPMLAPSRRGAHDERHLRAPDPAVYRGWSAERGVTLVTLAPELPGAIDAVATLREAGVVVSAGHSDATAAEAAAAEAVGLGLVTHLFNAMAPLHHRRPGLAGYALGTDRLGAGLIADGIHVDPIMVALALRALGSDRLVLVSDAVAAMGLDRGSHRLGGRTVRMDGNGVRLPDGTLAGSDLTLDGAVRNLVSFTGCPVEEALRCAAAAPARAIGHWPERGRLGPGAVADAVLLDDRLEVVATICRGRLVYLAEGLSGRVSGLTAPATEPPPVRG